MMRILSAEFLFDKRANGGTVVLFRSLWVTAIVYTVALLVKEVTDPASIPWTWSVRSLVTAIYETIPWIGAIFAGAYVAFYTRFSSQWTYLAGLYNQILQAQAASPAPKSKTLDVWWAAFIEDALELHLATKPMFAALIRYLLKTRPTVKQEFIDGVPGGSWRMLQLEEDVERVCKEHEEKWKKRAQKKGREAT